jgi:hypothetical protein
LNERQLRKEVGFEPVSDYAHLDGGLDRKVMSQEQFVGSPHLGIERKNKAISSPISLTPCTFPSYFSCSLASSPISLNPWPLLLFLLLLGLFSYFS